jgi:hypothetical protein
VFPGGKGQGLKKEDACGDADQGFGKGEEDDKNEEADEKGIFTPGIYSQVRLHKKADQRRN